MDEGNHLHVHPPQRAGCGLLCWNVFSVYRLCASFTIQAACFVRHGLGLCLFEFSVIFLYYSPFR